MSDIQVDKSLIELVKAIELPADVPEIWQGLYLRPIRNWLPTAEDTYREWPERPDCGHFFGGSYWYGLETAYPALTYAVACRAAQALGDAGGVSADRLLEHAIGAIRYLGFTHMSGPDECVRVEGPNPHCSLRKWGEASTEVDPLVDSFFMSSQTGGSVVGMGLAAWLLWEELDDETRQLAINVAA